MCPRCGSNKLKKRWTWSRYKNLSIHGMDYRMFLSRSTGLLCWDCGLRFIRYAKSSRLESVGCLAEKRADSWRDI